MWTATLERSIFLKSRDRASSAFAIASDAVGVDLDGDIVRDVRIGLGGVATVPCRYNAAQDVLRGQRLIHASASAAYEAAFASATPHGHNAFKVTLSISLVARALTTLRDREA